jgi:hypothetical protein
MSSSNEGKLFCGKRRDVIPPGYSGYDTEYNCLRRGIGVGLYLSRNGRPPPRPTIIPKSSSTMPWWVIVLIVFAILLMTILIVSLLMSINHS